jgi:universal stress protein A
MKTETLDSPETTAPPAVLRADAGAEAAAVIHLKSILVPVDFSEMSLKSLQYAVPLARQFGAKITLMHVVAASDHLLDFSYPVPLEEKGLGMIEEKMEALRAERIPAELVVQSIVRQGRTFDAILDAAREIEADLIIATTHGFTGLDRALLGSTAENLVRLAKCPVLVIRESERDFV